MNSIERFRALCAAKFGENGWQTALSRALGTSSRTVRRWASGQTPVPEEIMQWLEIANDCDPLHPRVIIGEDCATHELWLTYLGTPAFVAKMWTEEDDDDTQPIEGLTAELPGGTVLHSFIFLGLPSSIRHVLPEIQEAIDRFVHD
jgi:hypothetical protein